MGVYEENTTESKVGNKKTGVMKMKKLMVAILVLATASVFAGNGNGNGHGNGHGNGNDNGQVSETIQTALGNVRFDPATGAFNIQKGGDWVIQLYQP